MDIRWRESSTERYLFPGKSEYFDLNVWLAFNRCYPTSKTPCWATDKRALGKERLFVCLSAIALWGEILCQ